MANDTSTPDTLAPVTSPVADDAVGVPEAKWYVAIVNHNNELNVFRNLTSQGYEAYVASQQELRQRASGRKVKVDRVLIPSKVFIHCTERVRREIVNLPYIKRFMTNPAGRLTARQHRPMVTVPDHEMEVMQFMLGYSDSPVSIVDSRLSKGTEVEVVRGSLKGLRGRISEEPDGSSTLTVCLDILGSARVSIDPVNVTPVNSSEQCASAYS